MEVGDKKKAAILVAVLLMILCVGAFELKPKGQAPVVAKLLATGAAAAQHEKEIDEVLPSTITSTPFAKPQVTGSLPSSVTVSTSPQNLGPNRQAHFGGSSRMPPLEPADLSLVPGSKPLTELPAPGPGENTGNSQQQIKENKRTATLEAVLNVVRWTAVVTISGHEDMPKHCVIGDSIGGHLILGIDDSGITLLVGKKIVEVSVGSSVNI